MGVFATYKLKTSKFNATAENYSFRASLIAPQRLLVEFIIGKKKKKRVTVCKLQEVMPVLHFALITSHQQCQLCLFWAPLYAAGWHGQSPRE